MSGLAGSNVAVVTDSTASLPQAWAAAAGVDVLPLHVVVGRESLVEGVQITGAQVAELLRAGEKTVTTSGPSPGEFVEFYRDVAVRRGVDHIVSVHISGRISRTIESAQLAAAAVRADVEVTVIDSRTLGLAMGYAVCSGAEVAAGGACAGDVAAHIRAGVAECSAYFYVDTLEFLRRGGRIGAASALLGGALAIKPLLTVADGEVKPWERVRTRAKAMARLKTQTLADVDAHHLGGRAVRVAIHHCDAAERAEAFAAEIRTGSDADCAEPSQGAEAQGSGAVVVVDVVELGAVTAVHTGPGTLAVVIAPVVLSTPSEGAPT